ncbi:Uma2 family endonuclease [Marinactinospora rubrisoli]|uniref:Uma2 family endonuclease n=1 Tax=Marinactinospora rubrisoli TaxID=2715399 RepID=A0ABW2KLZ1_9ACTN
MTDDNGTQEETMSLAVQHASPDLAQLADDLVVPEGYRVEIIGGTLVVSPTPSGMHAHILTVLQGDLYDAAPEGHLPYQVVTITLPRTNERYIPDLVVLPRKVVTTYQDFVFPASELLLAVEITSPTNPENDRIRKLRGYALAAVPMYLLIDPLDNSASLFEEPHGGLYQRRTRVPFGGTLTLPDPFGVDIDTSAFIAPE